ncbi:MAG: DUF2058 domain-containing protein [Thiohalomonadaceae bacterium]
MGNSLQEQLLKLGLVDEKRVRQAKQQKRQEQKKNPAAARNDAQREQALKAQAEKAERDRELNRQRQEEADRKARLAQIKQMIDAYRLPKGDGEVAYHFIDGRKVRRLYVNPEVHRKLVSGGALVVKLHGQYHIVPAEIAGKIRERDPACVISAAETPPSAAPDPDDPYAKYQVPDDLMW